MRIEDETVEQTLAALQARAVHLWTVDLDAPPPAGGFSELSPAERARAAAFRFEHLRTRYIATHIALRRVLSRYAGLPPQAVRFGAGPHGKPWLENEPRIGFNLSHSESCAIIAVAASEIGVDIEQLRPMPDALALASRFFHPDEVRLLETAPSTADAFIRLWTLKEAWLKYCGKGLVQPLNSFSMLDPQIRNQYVTTHIPAPGGFVAAVVYAAPQLAHRAWSFNSDY